MAQTLAGLMAGSYTGATKLKIPTGITTFPPEILSLSPTLEILDLSGNTTLSTLPPTISQLTHLKIAFFSDCAFTTFPTALSQCPALEMIAFKNNGMASIPEDAFPPNLRWLILTNNAITSLPKSIGNCPRLQKCMLAGNKLTSLPAEMAQCTKLGLLRISRNQLSEIPSWLFDMPELAFLAFAGNPCAQNIEENSELDDILWNELVVHELLGEGASGVISKGVWQSKGALKSGTQTPISEPDNDSPSSSSSVAAGSGTHTPVAIKLFKGAVTSDGSPIDEMLACITAGSHPNLIDPIGKIQNHPHSKRGLVLQLIPPQYTNLGHPPNLQTCTRDHFPAGMELDVRRCVAILEGVADAAGHLHRRGITHGDLYAHNVLVDPRGHALLGDFGAASVYRGVGVDPEKVERVEVLGFGHLVEDLVGLVDGGGGGGGDETDDVVGALRELHAKCTRRVVLERPGFEEVVGVLRGLRECGGLIE